QGLGRFDGHALGQDAVDGEPEIAVLFGAADGKDGAIIALEVLLDLHPVHVADAHGSSRGPESAGMYRSVSDRQRGSASGSPNASDASRVRGPGLCGSFVR